MKYRFRDVELENHEMLGRYFYLVLKVMNFKYDSQVREVELKYEI